MSILRNPSVSLSNLRNAHVTLTNLRNVYGLIDLMSHVTKT